MWIRSQDKQLLTFVTTISMDASIENRVWIYNQDGRRLGTYATKERAIEILDQIQKFICNQESSREWNNIVGRANTSADFSSFDPVFEMPEK